MRKIRNRVFLLLMLCCCSKTFFAQSKKIDSLLTVLQTAKEDTNKVNTLNNLSRQLSDLARYTEARKYADDALLLAGKTSFKKGTATAFHIIGYIYMVQSNFTEALKNFQVALKIKEEIGDKITIVQVYINIGISYAEQGDYSEGLKNFQVALKLSEEAGDKKTTANLYNNIGRIHMEKGDFSESLKNYLASLKIREEIGDRKGVANSYNNIGVVYHEQSDYPEALKYYKASLKINEEIGEDKLTIAAAYNNIGLIYRIQGNYTEALKSHLASLKIKEEIGNKKGIGLSYQTIGQLYYDMDNYPEALKNYHVSLKIRTEIGDKQGIAVCYSLIGDIYKENGNYSEALKNYLAGLKIGEEIGDKKSISPTYFKIAEIDSAMGNYSSALKYYKLYSVYKDSMFNETSTKQIAQMREQYESEKKDKEIIQLESDKKALENEKQIGSLLLKAKQDSLGISNAEKERVKLENDKVKLENEKIQAFNLYNQQQIEFLGNEKKLQQLQIDKDKADYAVQKAETDKKQEQLVVLNKEKDIQDLQLTKQKQAKYYFLGGLVLFIILSFFVYRNYQNQRKLNRLMNVAYAKEKAELELHSLRAQLNPHFMFNSLNAIQELILKEDFDNSHTYLARFAKLVRMLLENAEKPFVQLNKEIDFLELYLSLERLRIPDLKSSITVNPSINTGETFLPNMILQPYIENALWHGLSQKEGEKKLELIVGKQTGAVIYNVKDNGVGRKKAAEFKSLYRKEHKSKGMELLTKRFKLLNEEFGSEIKTQVSDVMDNGSVEGTLVSINVPDSLSENAKARLQ